jgi:hypothetical protein
MHYPGHRESGTFWTPEAGAFLSESGAFLNESGALLKEIGSASSYPYAVKSETGYEPPPEDIQSLYGISAAQYAEYAAIPCPEGCYNVIAAGEAYSPAEHGGICFKTSDSTTPCDFLAPEEDAITHAEIQGYIAQGLSFSEALLKTFGPKGPPAGWLYNPGAFRPVKTAFPWVTVALGLGAVAAIVVLTRPKKT